METKNNTDDELDDLMRSSYSSLFINYDKTLSEFIIYSDQNKTVSVKSYADKIKCIDKLVSYFEKIEEFEKCADLIELKSALKK